MYLFCVNVRNQERAATSKTAKGKRIKREERGGDRQSTERETERERGGREEIEERGKSEGRNTREKDLKKINREG